MKKLAMLGLLAVNAWSQSVNLQQEYPKLIPSGLPSKIAPSIEFKEVTEVFPRPKKLLPSIEFWRRVYGEYTNEQAVFSDYDDLGLVYQVVAVPKSGKARDLAVKKAKQEIVLALKELDAIRPDSADDLSGTAKDIYLSLEENPREDKYQHWDNIRVQTGLKNQFEEGYRRSGAHEKDIKARLRNAGLPEELIGIVFVESLFHPKSRSSVGATGIWQFMKRTAYEFMRVNKLVDERLDPIVSTEAAIKYIKSAKASLKEWPLVITSYNYGRGGMAKAAEMVGTTDFDVILENYQNPRFGFAARNYYAEFLAAVDVYQKAEEIFPDVEPVSHWAYDVLQLPKATSVKDLLSTKFIEAVWLKTYNPALTKYAHQGRQMLPKGFTLRVPLEHKEKIEQKLANISKKRSKRSKRSLPTGKFTHLPDPVVTNEKPTS